MTDIRVTQDVLELLSQPAPAARVTQAVVEVLSATTPIPGRVTQYVVEVLSENLTAVVAGERVEPFLWMPV